MPGRRRPRHHARGRRRPRRRRQPRSTRSRRPSSSSTTRSSPTSSARPDAFARNVELEYERNRERYQFLRWGQTAFDDFKVVPPGTGIVHQVNIEYLARVVFARNGAGLPRHARRHRLAHHDGQRPGRARLGRRRHRGRGGHARPAGQHADPAVVGFKLDRRAARRLDRHRPRAHHHRDAAQARRGRQVRRVLRPRRRRGAAGQPRHDRQHEPGVRLDRARSSRSTTRPCATCASPAARPSRSRWSRPTPRSKASGTTRRSSRTSPRRSSSTCRRSCRRSPARSARRTASR